MVADVAYRDVKVSVAERRLKSPQVLRIVVSSKVEDSFTISPTPSMQNNFTDYRQTIGETLKKAFAGNFETVEIVSKETGQGVELVVLRAEMLPTTTIKYGVALLWDGKELLDATGESKGKTIMASGSVSDMYAKYDGMVEELTDYTLLNLADQTYDAVMRAQKLEDDGVYARLEEPAAAGPAPATDAPEAAPANPADL